MQPLSRRQKQILKFIEDYSEHGFMPSIREIGEDIGLSSSSTVHSHLRKLEAKGYLRRARCKPRSIELTSGRPSRAELVRRLALADKLAESADTLLSFNGVILSHDDLLACNEGRSMLSVCLAAYRAAAPVAGEVAA